MPYKNQIILKSGHAFEFEDDYGNIRQAFLRYLQNPGGTAHVCNQSGLNAADLTLDLREVVSVVTVRK